MSESKFRMAKIEKLHNWDLSPAEARQLQEKLSGKVSLRSMRKKVQFVGGLDCSLDKRGGRIFAAAVVFKMERGLPSPRCLATESPQRRQACPEQSRGDACVPLTLIETATAALPLEFPYVPGLLSFREIPVCLEAVKKVKHVVDLWLIDGQGIAHPRRIGLASHLGLFLNTPTIGCAKSRLIGTYNEPKPEKGNFSWLYDKDEKIGAVMRTRTNVKPLFISPGHLCGFDDAIKYTLCCTTKYRLPEPTRIAHQMVGKVKLSYCS